MSFEEELATRVRSAERRVDRLETLEASGGDGDWVFIAREDGSGGGAEFEFTDIPTLFKHLYIIYSLRGPGGGPGDTLEMQVNVDTGNNYDWFFRRFLPLAIGNVSLTGQAKMLIGTESAAAQEFSVGYILIPDYLNTGKFKSARGGVFDEFSALTDSFYGGSWLNTAAIVSLKFVLSQPPFSTLSLIDLYGIR